MTTHHPGSALRTLRKARGLTLRELAESAGISYAYLSKVERGERTPSELVLRSVTSALGQHMAERAA